MDVAIFENDLPFARWMERTIRQHLHTPTAINTDDPAVMQRYILQSNQPTLYLLDIVDENQGHRATGIHLANEVIKRNRGDLIVLVTAYLDRIITDTVTKGHLFNLIPKYKQSVETELLQTLALAGDWFDGVCLSVSDRLSSIRIPLKEINYIETVPRGYGKVQITGLYGQYVMHSTLKGIMEKLDKRFVLVHQSYIANTANIRHIDRSRKQIYFQDGSHCPYSRLYARTWQWEAGFK